MFKSERLPIIIPQQEHARLAGSLALFWGNSNFAKPAFPLEALAKGLIFHHVGYGSVDNVAFRELSEEELVKVFEGDIHSEIGDVDAELVNLFHQLRLINNRFQQGKSEKFRQLRDRVEAMISERLLSSQYRREDFEWANRITHLCDRLSFNFSQGLVAEAAVDVFPVNNSSDTIAINNQLMGADTIVVDPWPFLIPEITTLVVAYAVNNYPHTLIPYLVQVKVVPNK